MQSIHPPLSHGSHNSIAQPKADYKGLFPISRSLRSNQRRASSAQAITAARSWLVLSKRRLAAM